MSGRCLAAGLLSALTLAACGAERAPSAPAAAVRDSAGVRIVEYQELPLGVGQWAVSDTPDVVIGAADGDSTKAFGRVSGLAVGNESEIIVADGRAQQVRIFDAGGNFLRSAGGSGSGPGEFTSLASVYVTGSDSLVAVNHFSQSVAVFDNSGRYGRTVKLSQPTRAGYSGASVQGALSGGDLVVTSARDFNPAAPPGYSRGDFVLMLYDADGAPRMELGTFPDVEVTFEEMHGQKIARPLEMARYTIVAARDASIVAATMDRFEFRRYDAAGTLEQIVRVALTPRPVNDELRARYVEHELSRIDEAKRADTRAFYESAKLPETLPALEDVRIDPDGNVWVKEFVMPGDTAVARWWVFNTEGEITASVLVPPDLTHVTIGRDYVLGLAFDSLDVPMIQRHRMQRN